MSHCKKCDCEACEQAREALRVARILKSWPAGGLVVKRRPVMRLPFNSVLPRHLRFA
jgi:hypothetical protein